MHTWYTVFIKSVTLITDKMLLSFLMSLRTQGKITGQIDNHLIILSVSQRSNFCLWNV